VEEIARYTGYRLGKKYQASPCPTVSSM